MILIPKRNFTSCSFQSLQDCELDPVDYQRRYNECLIIVQSIERSRGNIFHGHDISAVTGIRKGKSGLGTRTKYLEKLRSAFLRHRRRADVERLK